MRNAVSLICLSTLCMSCATVPRQSEPWCNSNHVTNANLGAESSEVQVIPIGEDQIKQAYDKLTKRKFVVVDRSLLKVLSGQEPQSGMVYILLRNGVYGPPVSRIEDIRLLDGKPRTHIFQFRLLDSLLTVINVQGVRRETLHNVPLLIAAPFSPSAVQTFCYTHY
jgi:hypothetical protein